MEPESPTWGGACYHDEDEHPVWIVIAEGKSPLFCARVLAHELGHALLHLDKDYRAHTPRSRIECEAESVSFCILYHFGLDVGESAFGYLAQRGAGENVLTELLEWGARIREAAHQEVAWVDEQYAGAVPVEGTGDHIFQPETELVSA